MLNKKHFDLRYFMACKYRAKESFNGKKIHVIDAIS